MEKAAPVSPPRWRRRTGPPSGWRRRCAGSRRDSPVPCRSLPYTAGRRVSPTMRPMARIQPVTMPSTASRQALRCGPCAICRHPAPAPLPVGLGDGFQALLRGTDDGGAGSSSPASATGQNSRLKAQLLHEQHHAHHPKMMEGIPVRVSAGELDDADQPPAGGHTPSGRWRRLHPAAAPPPWPQE